MEADGFDDQSLGTAFPRQSLQVILCDEILVESPADDVVEFIVIQIDEISVFLVHGAVSLSFEIDVSGCFCHENVCDSKKLHRNSIFSDFLYTASLSAFMEHMPGFTSFAKRRIFFNGDQFLADRDMRLYLGGSFSVEKVLPFPENLLISEKHIVARFAVSSNPGVTLVHIVAKSSDNINGRKLEHLFQLIGSKCLA